MSKVEFTVIGLDELIESMDRHAAEAEQIFDVMLEAGAIQVQKAWKESAQSHGHVDTGEMLANVKWYKRPSNYGEMDYALIYPRGKDYRGKRHASKAFWRHYGTSQKAGTYWVDVAIENANEVIPGKLMKIWEQFLRS